jgi:putative peptidoglycan lipid II flippase
MQDTRTVFYLYAGENVLNILLAVLFYDGSRPWVLAGSYAAAYAVAAVVGLAILRRSLGKGWATGLGGWLIRWAIALAGAAIASVAFVVFLEDADDLVRLVVGGLVLVTVYMALAVGLGMREPSALIDVVRRRRRT